MYTIRVFIYTPFVLYMDLPMPSDTWSNEGSFGFFFGGTELGL